MDDRKVERKKAIKMSCCELGLGGCGGVDFIINVE